MRQQLLSVEYCGQPDLLGVGGGQAPLGLDSGILSLAAARKLGLAVVEVADAPA